MKNTQLTALVSGAVKGIGKAITEKLMHEGYFVIMMDLDRDSGKQMEIENEGNCIFQYADISKVDEVKSVFSFISSKFGNLDLLVNNAGIIKDNLIWNMPPEDFDSVISVNLKGTWLMCKEAAELMKKTG